MLVGHKPYFGNFEFMFHEDSQYTGVWKYWVVYKMLRCLS